MNIQGNCRGEPIVPGPAEIRPLQTAEGNQKHILVVDDEQSLAAIMKAQLENVGYRVTVCAGSDSALRHFRSEPSAFDLMLTDYKMPGRDGLQLCKALLLERPDMPVVVCTGNTGDLPPPATWPVTVRSLLEKPVSAVQLRMAVEQALAPWNSAD